MLHDELGVLEVMLERHAGRPLDDRAWVRELTWHAARLVDDHGHLKLVERGPVLVGHDDMAGRLNQILASEAMLLLSHRALVAAEIEDVLPAAAHLDAEAVVAAGYAALQLRASLDAVMDGGCGSRGAWARPRATLALHRLLRACRV